MSTTRRDLHQDLRTGARLQSREKQGSVLLLVTGKRQPDEIMPVFTQGTFALIQGNLISNMVEKTVCPSLRSTANQACKAL